MPVESQPLNRKKREILLALKNPKVDQKVSDDVTASIESGANVKTTTINCFSILNSPNLPELPGELGGRITSGKKTFVALAPRLIEIPVIVNNPGVIKLEASH